jgi:hypothetical protein
MKRDMSQLTLSPRPLAFLAPGDVQRALGAGDADIHQPPFFLDARAQRVQRRVRVALVRQDALLHADQKHVREFQSLGRMQRRQAHRVRLLVLAFQHGHQRHHLGQVEQALFRAGAVASAAALFLQPGGEIDHVLPLALGAAVVEGVVQIGFVVDLLHHVVQHFAGGLAGPVARVLPAG